MYIYIYIYVHLSYMHTYMYTHLVRQAEADHGGALDRLGQVGHRAHLVWTGKRYFCEFSG